MRHTRMMLVAAIALIVVPFAWSSGAAESAPAGVTELEFWTHTDVAMYEQWIAAFEAENPDVSITLVSNPWNDYWTKLPLSLQGGEGPDIFYQHIAFLENSIPHAAPYDPELMPYDELAATFDLVEENMIDGEVYYLPLATMTGSIFYNRDILSEVGVARVPETWDEFIALAQELTVTDDSGVVTRAGFSFNGMQRELNWALGYQMGLPIFDAAGRSTIASEKAQETLAYLVNLYEEEGIGSMLMSGNAWDQFANGRAAMVYVYGWVYGWMAENAPGVDFGVAPLPSFDGTPPAFDRNNLELMIGVSRYTDDAKAAAGQRFIDFILDNEYFLIDYAVRKGAIPTRFDLRSEPTITSHPLFSVVQRTIDRTIYPGAFPVAIEPGYNRLFENVFLNGMPISEAVVIAEREINQAIDDTGFTPTEVQYAYYDEFSF
jgi:multiple sugar transport system substrate-binding protein